jgi:carboxymethylenebutenolidase
MCYEDKDRPPLPPGAAGGARGEKLVLAAEDGNRFRAYAAEPTTGMPGAAQVLIYPDVRGLHGFYQDLALRLADVGLRALAMDYFGRTAGLGRRDETFEYRPHVEQMQVPQVLMDTRAALAHLKQGEGAGRATFILGFCRGGSLSLYAAGEDLGLKGIIAFYPGMGRRLDPERGTPLDAAPRIRVPVLGLFGGADQGIPPEHVQGLEAALDQAGVEHELVTYPGAPHSFFDRAAEQYAEASADAWRRVLAFVRRVSTDAPGATDQWMT